MLKYQKILINLVISLTIMVVANWWIPSPALAITQEIRFDTTAGYVVKTIFSYDEAQNPQKIKEYGQGKTETIDSLKVSFYKPSGELIADYDNIVDGMAAGSYFEFGFDPVAQRIYGNIDIGGESAGEMYLKGKAESELSLIEVTELGEEKAIDRVSP
ncbi:MAG: hypothetical protein ACFCAD_16575 [Pleurocapsa sp.]